MSVFRQMEDINDTCIDLEQICTFSKATLDVRTHHQHIIKISADCYKYGVWLMYDDVCTRDKIYDYLIYMVKSI